MSTPTWCEVDGTTYAVVQLADASHSIASVDALLDDDGDAPPPATGVTLDDRVDAAPR